MQPRISSGPVEPIMKVSLLVNLIERPQLRGRHKCGRIDERSREVRHVIVIEEAERILIVKTHSPRQALNTFGQSSSIHLLLFIMLYTTKDGLFTSRRVLFKPL